MAVAGATLVSDQALVAAELRLCRRDGRQTDGVNHRKRRGPKIRDFQAASALHGWHAALGSAEPHVMLAVPCRVMLACDAKRARAACIMHGREAFLACSGLTKTLVLRCCTGTVCLCSPKGLYDPQVHMLVKSHCYIRMLSDRECIFYEYLRPVAV